MSGARAETALRAVSRETARRLETLVSMLQHWQPRINLVSPHTLSEVWTRHVADSMQIAEQLPNARHWLDLGSGGGFPGLVIAAQLAETGEPHHVHLVESNAKKCAFLRSAAREMDVYASVHCMRIDAFFRAPLPRIDAVSARALAPLSQLLELAKPLLTTGIPAVFPKGRDVSGELTEAEQSWKVNCRLVPSRTDPDGALVVVYAVEKVA
jgi:16S rRNA (guanine527-N7)-methyltransferase